MLRQKSKGLFIFLISLLFMGFTQFAIANTSTVVKPALKLQPKKISSRLALANLIMSRKTNRFYRYPLMYDMALASPASNTVASSSGANKTTVSHSDTNIQVQGVDEADTVKVGDDGYIYQLHNNTVRIIKGFPVTELNHTAVISFPDSNFSPTGLFIQNGKLAVLGSAWQSLAPLNNNTKPVAGGKPIAVDMPVFGGWWWNNYSQTRVFVYDVNDPANPKQERDLSIDGDYIDSRRIADNIYFITRTYPHYYMYGDTNDSVKLTLANMLPNISDTKSGKTSKSLLALKDISYFSDFVEPDYVIASSINLQKPEQALNTKAYLGAGDMVYASTQSLYLSASKYNFGGTGDVVPEFSNTMSTQIFKFAIQDGQINFSAAGEVAGTVLNQFSMDENGDYFRIATTTHNWFNNQNQTTNSLFVLNKNMKTVGKLDDLAPGEQIYSTRFLGERCYIVTFKLVDPLFAIDLSNPQKPTVMGELKIPGYSNYLHPYDETHLIGFGKDAAVYNSEQGSADQWWAGGSAFYQGLKVALFDVADMKNPKELYSVTIGERGSNSPLLWNHKALFWDSERHLFGFPVETYTLANGFDAKQPWLYGMPNYQGAYIYEVTPEKGFNLKAKLSHIPDTMTPHIVSDYGYQYAYWDSSAYDLFIDRLLRIDTNLYTLSNNQINVYDLNQYEMQNSLELKP